MIKNAIIWVTSRAVFFGLGIGFGLVCGALLMFGWFINGATH